MAVKTQFSKDNFIQVLASYDLGRLKEFRALTEGTVQTNYLLHTTTGKFVFRYYETRSYGAVAFESDLISYLKDKDYPCPAIYADKQGNFIGTIKGKPFVIFEFVDGEHVENPTESQQAQLIKNVAQLQILTQHYKPHHTEHRWNYGVELCKALAQNAAETINTANAREKLTWYERELATLDLPESLPRGICHGDFHFSNILFKAGEFKALIDFDDANYTYLTYDLATLMNPFIPEFDWNTWFHFKRDAHVLNFTQARKAVAEYSKHRPLGDNERSHLFDVFKLTVMLDCIWYFQRGDVDDFYERRKIEHLNHLGRGQFYKEIFPNG